MPPLSVKLLRNPVVWMPQMRERTVATAAVATSLLLCLAACGGHDSSNASSSPRTSAPTSPGTTTPTLKAPHYRAVRVDASTLHASQATTHSYVAGSMALLASPQGKPASQPTIAGTALANLLEMRQEYADKHYRVVGRPKVVSQKVIRRQSHPERLVVAACLDNSKVKVLDKFGKPVTSSRGPERVMNLLTLTLRGGHWVVTKSALPDNPTC